MSDHHLTNARACVTSASQAPDAGCAISWLTVTCKQIIAHLEAQQAAAPQDDDDPWTPDTAASWHYAWPGQRVDLSKSEQLRAALDGGER